MKPNLAALVAGNTDFALDLYRQLRRLPGNLCFSPYSLSCALAMTYAGARGETARQMAATLYFSLPEEQLHPAFAALRTSLDAAQIADSVQLLAANALWPALGLPLRSELVDCLKSNYASDLVPQDFTQPKAVRHIINKWAKDWTQGKIVQVLRPGMPQPDAALVLTNAVYFKGLWTDPFEPESTKPLPFYLNATERVTVQMMYRTFDSCGYLAAPGVQALELAYQGDRFSMVVLLPNEVDGLEELERELTEPRLKAWIGGLEPQEVGVWLPKFRITSGVALDEQLKAMGMGDAFGAVADFSGMFQQRGPFLSAILHKVFVEVNEQGTEAAALSALLISFGGHPDFRADHPFLFLIRDRSTGSILFLGRVTDPREFEAT